MREKLIKLLESTVPKEEVAAYGEVYVSTSRVADHLIANGVTLDNQVSSSKWIPVSERLPTFYDADADNCVLAIHKASNKRYYHWRSVVDNPFDFTHWMRTPQPPKEG